MLKLKSKDGITLIALVITIIVLLLLAGISISMLSGDNSILKKVQDSKLISQESSEKEEITLASNAAMLDNLGGKVTVKNIRNNLRKQGKNVAIFQNGDTIEVYFLDTNNSYKIKADGQIEKLQNTGNNEAQKYYYKIDGTTLYLNNIKKDETYKESEDDYYMSLNMSNGWKLPEWGSTIEINEEGKKVITPSTIEKVIIENRIQPKKTGAWFWNCTNLKQIEMIENLDTRFVNDMSYMFYNCSSLTEVDVSSFITTNVTTMQGMFLGCSELTELDVSNFDVSNVTDIASMFMRDSKIKKLDVSNWNTGKVKQMAQLFATCSSLKEIDVSNWDTSNVEYMHIMFYGCSELTKIDISKWDTRKLTYTDRMFAYCTKLDNLDFSNFNTSEVTNMNCMFAGCESLSGLDLSNFNTSKVTTMTSMFNGCSALTKLEVSSFNTSNVTDMSYMFNSLYELEELDISNFDTTDVINYKRMFNNSTKLKNIYVGENWKTEKNTGETTYVFPSKCDLPNFSNSNNAYRDLKWAYVGEGGYLSKKEVSQNGD